MKFKNLDQVRSAVESNDGILSIEMGELRDAYGAGKLGVNVVSSISHELLAQGIKHWPPELPVKQWERVRLFKANTNLANIIELLNKFEDANDNRLIELTTSEAQHKIEQIKKILG